MGALLCGCFLTARAESLSAADGRGRAYPTSGSHCGPMGGRLGRSDRAAAAERLSRAMNKAFARIARRRRPFGIEAVVRGGRTSTRCETPSGIAVNPRSPQGH